MGNRRFAQVPSSDEEDDAPPPPPRNSIAREARTQRKRKKVHFPSDDEDFEAEKEIDDTEMREQYNRRKKKKREESEPETDSENEEQEDVEAQPVGKPIRTSGKGRGKTDHYEAFNYDGIEYQLEDPVLLAPDKQSKKPYVAIIKDISLKKEGSLMVTGQWFYRPEEAIKKTGGNWQSRDTRELFYSFHRDDVPAESIMHKCVVHFIPRNKQIPNRKEHPGFIIQRVYDTKQRKLFKLTDKDYEDNNQHEIDLLVQKTFARVGDIPDIEPEDANTDQEEQIKNKRLLRKNNVSPLDVPREDEGNGRSQLVKAETPGSTHAGASEYYTIISNFKMLTGETQRDKWLEKLLASIQFMCSLADGKHNDEEQQGGTKNYRNESQNKGGISFDWPDAAVPAVAALEQAAHHALSADFQKYNQKMRQLSFNLKNVVLARRLLNKELEPAQILNMSPIELKEGLTAEETARREPEEPGRMQMTDARCKRCSEKQVGLTDIIGDRYQLECVACGNTWYASRDDVAALTIEGPRSGKTVATAEFQDNEKNLVSPCGGEKGTNDVMKITEEELVAVSENQTSVNETQAEENPATNKAE